MIKIKHTNPSHCDPPGAFVDILQHPFDRKNKTIEKAIIKEHRFAFFYWMKWYKELKREGKIESTPLLVTIDHHRDLASSQSEKDELKCVEYYDLSDLALFCWARMNPLNDGHILSAAYVNIIGDIVLLKGLSYDDDTYDKPFIDRNGNKHIIVEFTELDEFEEYLIQRNDSNVFFDIDLDYFILSEGNFSDRDSWEMMNEKRIRKIINLDRPFVNWILKRIDGYTIATEPEYCGGIQKSYKILSIIEEQFFTFNGHWKF